MKAALPSWAIKTAGPEDLGDVRAARGQGTLQIKWADSKVLRDWARQRDWSMPWLGVQEAFLTRMLEDEASFALALKDGLVEIHLPKTEHTISAEALRALDESYAERSESGRPTGFRYLVESLREIRRAVEAGIVVNVEGAPPLRTWQGFYTWAHERYHMLEEGSDEWIGADP